MKKAILQKAMILAFASLKISLSKKSVYQPILTSSLDPSSFANVDFIRTIDFNISMNVYFDNSFIDATNILTLEAV
jgi:hypothetical protein